MREIIDGVWFANCSWLGKSLEYIQKMAPTLSATITAPRVSIEKIEPKMPRMNRTTRTPNVQSRTIYVFDPAGSKGSAAFG